jgi:hypothetical protein
MVIAKAILVYVNLRIALMALTNSRRVYLSMALRRMAPIYLTRNDDSKTLTVTPTSEKNEDINCAPPGEE